MSDNRKRDIFYGVVAVATLIVALIGATLAYFSISVNSVENAVTGTAAKISIVYADGRDVIAQADELIPSSWDVVDKVYNNKKDNIGTEFSTDDNICIDSNGKQVCSIYRFSIKSDSTTEYDAFATLNSELNGFTYLNYAVRDVNSGAWLDLDDQSSKFLPISKCDNGDDENLTDCTGLDDKDGKTKVYNYKNSLFGKTLVGNDPKFVTVEVTETEKVYDVVLFILDNDQPQNEDQGQQFYGTIFVDVSDGSTIKGYVNY